MRLKSISTLGFLLLICSLAPSASCQTINGVYRGTLGKQEIVLEIGVDPEHKGGEYLVGRYFYRRHGIGIFIKGTRTEGGAFLMKEYKGVEQTGDQWKLKFQDDAASGSFCKCDLQKAAATQARLLPISLKRISSDFDANFDLAINEETKTPLSHQAYYNLLVDFPLTASAEVATSTGYAYSIITDPRFTAGMPNITKFPDAAAMMKINTLLQRELTRFRLEAADCLQNGSVGEFDISTKVELFTRHLLTIVREGDYYCGGPHPGNYLRINTYDFDSGTETSAAFLLAREIDPAAVKKVTKDSKAAGNEAILRLVAEFYRQHYKPDEEECRTVIEDTVDTASFATYLSENGLVIVPDVPHVAQTCADPVVIRYDELRPLLKNGSQFLTLVGSAR